MPELVARDKKATAVEAVLREALPRLRVDLPKDMKEKAAKFAAGAFDCLKANPNLLEAAYNDPERLRGAVIEAARYGLWIGPTMQADAHLVVFKHKGVPKLQLVTNYRGLVKIAYNTGQVQAINRGTVREGDSFDWDEGNSPYIRHRKAASSRGDVTYAWASVRMKGSDTDIVKVLNRDEIETVRTRAPGAEQDAWMKWYDEQAEKTVLKRCLKTVPRSEELSRVLALDDAHLAGKEQRFEAEVTRVEKVPSERLQDDPGAAKPSETAQDTTQPPDAPEAVPAPQKPQRAQKSRKPSDDEAAMNALAEEAETATTEAAVAAQTKSADPDFQARRLRQKLALRMADLGCQTHEQREGYLGQFGLKGGLSSQTLLELQKLQAWLAGPEGQADLKAFLKESLP